MKKILLLFTICTLAISCFEEDKYAEPRTSVGPIFIGTTSEVYDFLNYAFFSAIDYSGSSSYKNGYFVYNNSNCVIINREFEVANNRTLHIHLTVRPDIGDSTLRVGKRYSSKEFTVFDYNTHKERVKSVYSSIRVSWREVSGLYHAHTSEVDEAWVEFTDFSSEKVSGRFFMEIKDKEKVALMIDGYLNNYHLLLYDYTTDEKY